MAEKSYKVLILAMEFPPSAVGTATYASRLAQGLSSKGAEVLVLAPRGERRRRHAFDREQPYRIVRMPCAAAGPWRYLVALRWLRRTLRRFRPHSLWTTNGASTRIVGLLWEAGGPDLSVVSCLRGSDILTRLPGKGLLARLQSIPQRRCYRLSSAIAAASGYLKRTAEGKGVCAEKIFINSSGFDFSRIADYHFDPHRLLSKYPFLRHRRAVLTVSRLTGRKRVDLAIRAVAIARRQVPDLCHVVVGDGPQMPQLERLVRDLGASGYVFLLGSIPPMSEELYDLYSSARIFMMTSVREGMANVFMEAGAFELPSIGADHSSTPEIIVDGETGVLALPDDVGDTAARLVDLLADPERCRRMGTRARKRIEERFSAEAVAERSYRVLQAVAP